MERELPDYDVAGIRFYVDILKDELRQVSDPTNRIPFDAMTFRRGQYEFDFDRATKSAYHGDPHAKPESVVTIKMPHPYRLDPDIQARILERIGSKRGQQKTQTKNAMTLKA